MAYKPCSMCTRIRIRIFMFVGFFLMICMYLQPQSIVTLASKMPSPMSLGLGIVLIGSVLAVIRWLADRVQPSEGHS